MNKSVQDLLNNLPYNAKIEIKSGWFWNFLGFLVKVFSLGRNKTFMSQYVTTIGNIITMPVSIWDMRETAPEIFYETVCHELTHIKQYKTLGLGSIWLGVIVQSLVYLFLPLPFGLAYGRYYFEREAYIAGFKAFWRWYLTQNKNYPLTLEEVRSDYIQSTYVDMTSSDYIYAMAFAKSWVNKDLTTKFNAITESDIGINF